MTITIDLSPETERKLRERAAELGQDVTTVAETLIELGVKERPTLDEFLAPFRKQVRESGMTDDELATFFEEMREEVWREQHGSGQ
jgi:hypothetical protein